MTGFILAAGFGTRLRPITDHLPKALVPVCGISLLEHAYRFLRRQGVERIGANMHHYANQIEVAVEERGLELLLHHERARIRGTGGALYFAREFLSEHDVFCVCNCDIVLSLDLRALLGRFDERGCMAALAAAPAVGTGSIRFEPKSGRYLGTRGDTDTGEPADFIGVALYRKAFLEFLTEQDFSVVPVWKRACEQGSQVCVMIQQDVYWKDTGTPAALAQIHFDAIDGACGLDIAENIYVDWEKKIAYPVGLNTEARASLGPYTWCNSTGIAPGSSITRSVVFEGAAISEPAEISSSIITPWGGVSFD